MAIVKDEKGVVMTFASALTDKMEQTGTSIGDLAKKLDTTYEHTRKLTKALAFPSKFMLKQICELMKMNFKEQEQAVLADKLRSKFGTMPDVIAGKDPRFRELEEILPNLTEAQFDMILASATGMAEMNNKHKARKSS